MANSSKSSPRRIEARERSARALELRKQGYTFEQIASALGYRGRQGAFESVMSALREEIREPAAELRSLDLERMDALWRAQYPAAVAGDVVALNACLRILERRAKLLGLDAKEMPEPAASPAQSVLVVPYFSSPAEWEAVAAPAQAALKAAVRD